jgi:hypothetical protein
MPAFMLIHGLILAGGGFKHSIAVGFCSPWQRNNRQKRNPQIDFCGGDSWH